MEISIVAKRHMNGKETIYDINKDNVDNDFCNNLYCEKCGCEDRWEMFKTK
jgi:phosphoribosylaminoimidazole carboxylase (NCAIR synthetase)